MEDQPTPHLYQCGAIIVGQALPLAKGYADRREVCLPDKLRWHQGVLVATFSEMTPPLPIISLLVGIAILFFGRRLFWLFVAAVGFAAGMELTPYLMQHPPVWLAIVLSLALGIIGALLAFLLQKIAIAIAGFLVGGRAAVAIVAAVMVNHGQYNGITFVIGGIIGAILLLLLFDWALIIFSAIAGAELITTNIHIPPTGGTILLLLLAIFGIVVQSAMLRRRRALA